MGTSFVHLVPHVFPVGVAVLLASTDWSRRWLYSGAPLLTYSWLIGAANGYRVFPLISLWTLITTLNLLYSIAATSWLLYWVFLACCYPALFASCLFQFETTANVTRRVLRSFLKQMHFVDDKIALFDLPALEIDTEVDGILVIKGITISLASFTIVAHGVEVGIKLSDDMELSVATDEVTVALLRSIKIGNVYANLKGGGQELSLGRKAGNTRDEEGEALMVDDETTPKSEATAQGEIPQGDKTKMKERMTDQAAPKPKSPLSSLRFAKPLYLLNEDAKTEYYQKLNQIADASAIVKSQNNARAVLKNTPAAADKEAIKSTHNDFLAATCSHLRDQPSVLHPPEASVKVTALRGRVPSHLKKFMHRLPMLYRLFLNPLSYFHPIAIDSITTMASGMWIQHALNSKIFESETGENTNTVHLQERVSTWLTDTNFALCLGDISAWAHVPFLADFFITIRLMFEDVMVFRAPSGQYPAEQVIHLGGADGSLEIPAFLLPHHEHLLPPPPNNQSQREQEAAIAEAGGKPKEIQAQRGLEQIRKDETNMKISVHGRLPMVLDQELLDWVAALVKAMKLVEMEQEPSPMDEDVNSFKEFSRAVKTTLRANMGKSAADVVANDKWIAKLTGKVTQQLETAHGDVGYSGKIPISLKPYRETGEEAPKILA